jgi:hypothetical protein
MIHTALEVPETEINLLEPVFTAATRKTAVFWDVRPCNLERTDASEKLSPPSSG